MPRTKNRVASKARRKKVLDRAKGFWGTRKSNIETARNAVDKALAYAYVGRKQKKRDYRSLWIERINAGARQEGLSYSKFMDGLKKAHITLNRKALADLAMNQPAAFKAIAAKVK
ncbi:MAG TPA: 50S ribosomal protein L20 [Chitinophagales bacterium]|nr:50S ribosomal protein L20 [Chitinophagales bacterium]